MILIEIEGVDGAGTSSVLRGLMNWKWLKNWATEIVFTMEPSEGPVGDFIREILERKKALGDGPNLNSMLAHLFVCDRLWHLDRLMISDSKHKVVITDRYKTSSIVYQGREAACLNLGIREADLSILIDVDLETAINRITKRRENKSIFESTDTIAHHIKKYKELARLLRFTIIDGTEDLDNVVSNTKIAIQQFLQMRPENLLNTT